MNILHVFTFKSNVTEPYNFELWDKVKSSITMESTLLHIHSPFPSRWLREHTKLMLLWYWNSDLCQVRSLHSRKVTGFRHLYTFFLQKTITTERVRSVNNFRSITSVERQNRHFVFHTIWDRTTPRRTQPVYVLLEKVFGKWNWNRHRSSFLTHPIRPTATSFCFTRWIILFSEQSCKSVWATNVYLWGMCIHFRWHTAESD